MDKQLEVKENKPAAPPKIVAKPTPPKTKVIYLGAKKRRGKKVVVLRDDEDHDLR